MAPLNEQLSSDTQDTSEPPTRSLTSERTPDEQEKIIQWAAVRARRNASAKTLSPVSIAAQGALDRVQRRPGLTDAQIAAYEAEQAKRDRSERAAECIRLARIPPKYAGIDLAQHDRIPQDAREKYAKAATTILRMIDQPAIVTLIGRSGTGKTSMAWGLIQAFAAQGFSGRYVKAGDFIDMARASWGGGSGPTSLQVQADFVRPSLLVLDEMQVRGETASEDTLLLRLIDKRYDVGRATLMISNHTSKAELHNRLDARIVSRMRDGGGTVLCDWNDLRGRVLKPGR